MNAIAAEIRLALRLARSYWIEYVLDFVLYVLGFLLLMVIFRTVADDFGSDGRMGSLLGYITWLVCANVMAGIAMIVEQEARTGTLEQLFITGLRPDLAILGRAAGISLHYISLGIIIGVVLAKALDVLQPIPFLAAVIFFLTLIGACGLGFVLAGMALVAKRTEGLIRLTWQMLVFFSGALTPLYQPALSAVSKMLPLSWGIDSLRAIFLEGADALSLWQSGLLVGLLFNTAFYVALGYALFSWGYRQARILGTLAHY